MECQPNTIAANTEFNDHRYAPQRPPTHGPGFPAHLGGLYPPSLTGSMKNSTNMHRRRVPTTPRKQPTAKRPTPRTPRHHQEPNRHQATQTRHFQQQYAPRPQTKLQTATNGRRDRARADRTNAGPTRRQAKKPQPSKKQLDLSLTIQTAKHEANPHHALTGASLNQTQHSLKTPTPDGPQSLHKRPHRINQPISNLLARAQRERKITRRIKEPESSEAKRPRRKEIVPQKNERLATRGMKRHQLDQYSAECG